MVDAARVRPVHGLDDSFVMPVSDTRVYRLLAGATVVPRITGVAKYMASNIAPESTTMPDTATVLPNAFPTKGNWTSGQLKLAFAFYCQTPFGKLHSKNPKIVELAGLIGRTPGALAMKLVNFASLDPSITDTGRKGLSGASAKDREIWDEFHADWETLAVECAQMHRFLQQKHGVHKEAPQSNGNAFDLDDYTGETREAIVQERVKQHFFRRAVLASYRGRCCISGVSDPRFLIASHILPWREDKANRLNPSNGLCLSAIHDKAFDQHLFTLSRGYCVVLSDTLKQTRDDFLREVFWSTEGKVIELPDRFAPASKFLDRHRAITLAATEGAL